MDLETLSGIVLAEDAGQRRGTAGKLISSSSSGLEEEIERQQALTSNRIKAYVACAVVVNVAVAVLVVTVFVFVIMRGNKDAPNSHPI